MRLRLGWPARASSFVGHVALSCLASAPRASVLVAQLRIRVPEH